MSLETTVDKDSLREKVLEVAKRHKASWLELGQYLYTIYSDKFYKDWGYLSFETYCWKELALKQTTAMKLLKSYYFLEKEEPKILNELVTPDVRPKEIPNYESVNLLRLARENKSFTQEDYKDVRESVIGKVSEPKEVRAQVKRIATEKIEAEQDPKELRRSKRNTAIKKLITFIGNVKNELSSDRLVPDYLIKQMSELVAKLEDQLE